MTGLAESRGARPQRRQFRRVPVTSGAIELEAAGERPRVVDLAPGGVSVAVGAGVRWAGPLGQVALRLPEARFHCRAEAVRRVTARDGSSIVGLRLDLERPAREAVAAVYHRFRFPALSRRGQIAGAVVRDLFDRSGYTALKRDVVPSAEWLAANWPDSLTREAVYTARDGAVLGHIGVTRAYSRTWLGHEIATLRDHPEAMDCRRTLYHHFATWPRLLDGEDTMLIGYYNRARPWHRRMFEDFAAGVDPRSECLVLPLDRFAAEPLPIDDEDTEEAERDLELRLVTAGPEESKARREAAALIAATWPALAVRALDLEPDTLTSPALHPEYPAAGLERGRVALVVRCRGALAGVALCEFASGQLSLFNVLNCAQIFLSPTSGPGQQREAVGRALVRGVRRFFQQRGIASPLLIASPGTLPQQVGGVRLIETMGSIIWTARGLGRYEDYIDQALGAPSDSATDLHPTPAFNQPRRSQ